MRCTILNVSKFEFYAFTTALYNSTLLGITIGRETQPL